MSARSGDFLAAFSAWSVLQHFHSNGCSLSLLSSACKPQGPSRCHSLWKVHVPCLLQGIPPTYRVWVWEQVSGAAKLQSEYMNNYYEAMVHQGQATSPSAHQIELVTLHTCLTSKLACYRCISLFVTAACRLMSTLPIAGESA